MSILLGNAVFEIDPSIENQEYVEDCQICCNPILIRVSVGFDDIEIQTAKEDEGFYKQTIF